MDGPGGEEPFPDSLADLGYLAVADHSGDRGVAVAYLIGGAFKGFMPKAVITVSASILISARPCPVAYTAPPSMRLIFVPVSPFTW